MPDKIGPRLKQMRLILGKTASRTPIWPGIQSSYACLAARSPSGVARTGGPHTMTVGG